MILWETWNISHDFSGEHVYYTIIGITIFNYSQRKFSPDDFLMSESYLRPTDDRRHSIGILTEHDRAPRIPAVSQHLLDIESWLYPPVQ